MINVGRIRGMCIKDGKLKLLTKMSKFTRIFSRGMIMAPFIKMRFFQSIGILMQQSTITHRLRKVKIVKKVTTGN